MKKIMACIATLLLVMICQTAAAAERGRSKIMEPTKAKTQIATLAGGCFWCTQSDLEKLPGVVKVVSGYTGGTGPDPDYETYSEKGHVEAVQVFYDPTKLSYEKLIDAFWRSIDPTDGGGQFADRGPHYRSVIFYHDDEQRRIAEKSRAALAKSGRFAKPIATEILKFTKFYEAEEYHQGYSRKNPMHYLSYRYGSGRQSFLEKTWKQESCPLPPAAGKTYRKPDEQTLRKKLSPLQYEVTQREGTEAPFQNEYWNNKRDGIYVDVVSGEPLFSSLDKYDSGTGWPSFTRPLEPGNVVEREDRSLLMSRTEVRSRVGDSHLGHVFNDGPPPTGLRYCMNSAALRFIPREDLEKEGYGQYRKLFETKRP